MIFRLNVSLIVAMMIAACGQSAGDRLFAEKASPRLLSMMNRNQVADQRFDVVISMNDSSGVHQAIPAVRISSRSVAVGNLTAKEIHELAMVPSVIRIDASKTFFPDTPK